MTLEDTANTTGLCSAIRPMGKECHSTYIGKAGPRLLAGGRAFRNAVDHTRWPTLDGAYQDGDDDMCVLCIPCF